MKNFCKTLCMIAAAVAVVCLILTFVRQLCGKSEHSYLTVD